MLVVLGCIMARFFGLAFGLDERSPGAMSLKLVHVHSSKFFVENSAYSYSLLSYDGKILDPTKRMSLLPDDDRPPPPSKRSCFLFRYRHLFTWPSGGNNDFLYHSRTK